MTPKRDRAKIAIKKREEQEMDKTTFTRYDLASQPTTTNVWHTEIGSNNMNDVRNRLDNLRQAMDAITRAGTARVQTALVTQYPTATRAGSRELKWLLRVRDTVTAAIFTIELGTASEAAPIITTIDGRKLLAPASPAYSSLANAIADVALSPYGNSLTLVSAELVGRNI